MLIIKAVIPCDVSYRSRPPPPPPPPPPGTFSREVFPPSRRASSPNEWRVSSAITVLHGYNVHAKANLLILGGDAPPLD